MEISAKPKGRPPIILDIEEKLIKFLKAVGVKGGVVNIHVVRATPKALNERNGSCSQQLQNFSMLSEVGPVIVSPPAIKKKGGTTGRTSVHQGLYYYWRQNFLQDADKKIKQYNVPSEHVLNSDQTPSSSISVGKFKWQQEVQKTISIKGITGKRATCIQ